MNTNQPKPTTASQNPGREEIYDEMTSRIKGDKPTTGAWTAADVLQMGCDRADPAYAIADAHNAAIAAAQPKPASDLEARITEYLVFGGLFNPELMEHEKVRDLLMDCRDALQPKPTTGEQEFRDTPQWHKEQGHWSPKPTGEWTAESILRDFSDHKTGLYLERVADAHNSALAAERKRKPVILNSIPMFNEKVLSATIAEATKEHQKQLAAENGKVQTLTDALSDIATADDGYAAKARAKAALAKVK